jgi:hypothetical protein
VGLVLEFREAASLIAYMSTQKKYCPYCLQIYGDKEDESFDDKDVSFLGRSGPVEVIAVFKMLIMGLKKDVDL